MLIENSFEVAADPDEVYRFLQDAHNVAACFPGAELTEDLGDDSYQGKVKIKVGPVTAAYQGVAKVVERDAVARTAVLLADGKDTRGSGTAKARATMRVTPAGEGSSVVLATDLTISGKLAQFGRGIMADVSGRMVGELASRVRERIEQGEPAAAPTAAAPANAAATEPSAAQPALAVPAPAAPPVSKPRAEVPPMKASELIRIVLAGMLERWAARLRAPRPVR
ncbi:SRPBCC family protein [Amycolatopsis sp. RTGN1]|uniref:SRPBCC family protein n=1 Tax=Amycolatopsis ponsaeliensis TaxID=2992142 RepID=UPI00255194E4|nr:SRPBCC family protein [Amycolatopsis sp. RTGN1]